MTTLTIQIPDNETDLIKTIADIVKEVEGTHMDINSDDDGLSEKELLSISKSLKEAVMIKNGKLKSLSMDDLWDE